MKLEDNLRVGRLIDIYGTLLTSKQLEIISNYYFDNLSLSEIGDNYGISRQAVKCSIDQSLVSLEDYEKKLGIINKRDRLIETLSTIVDNCQDDNLANEITSVIKEIRS